MKAAIMLVFLVVPSLLSIPGASHGQPLCILTLSPSILYFEPGGGAEEVRVTPSSPDCPVTAQTVYPWITVSVSQQAGKSVVNVQVESISRLTQRVGSVMVGNSQLEIVQQGRNLLSW